MYNSFFLKKANKYKLTYPKLSKKWRWRFILRLTFLRKVQYYVLKEYIALSELKLEKYSYPKKRKLENYKCKFFFPLFFRVINQLMWSLDPPYKQLQVLCPHGPKETNFYFYLLFSTTNTMSIIYSG